jgi:hypothetical protein
MWRGNHALITRDALKQENLEKSTVEFIVGANRDSDDRSKGKHHAPQHFQKYDDRGKSDISIQIALSFFNEALTTAIDCVKRHGDEDIVNGLYSLGRALHCIQDFYAHSNWIFLKASPKDIWLGSVPHNLYLCYLTPGWMTQNIDHKPWVPQFHKKKRLSYKNEEDRKEWLHIILSEPVYHPDIHLDRANSWASNCYERLFKEEPKNGYYTAKALAIKHTVEVWNTFKQKIGHEGRRALVSLDVPKKKRSDWLHLDKNFNLVMKI